MSPTNTSARRARLLGASLLVAVFVGGAFSGAALDRIVAASPDKPTSEAKPDRDDDDRDGRRGHVFEQLDLTPEQRAKIDEALERRREQMDAFWVEARPRLRSIVDSARDDVRAVLTPEQRAEYDRLLAERKEEDKRRRDDDRERKDDKR